jgi:hypothetical protein
MEEVMRRLENRPKHSPMRPESSEPDPLRESVRIGLMGDFGTGLYGAPVTAATIQGGSICCFIWVTSITPANRKRCRLACSTFGRAGPRRSTVR